MVRQHVTWLSHEINIHGGCRPVPKQRSKLISNPKTKQNLAAFLCESLRKNIPARLGPLQKVVRGGGFKDGLKAVWLTLCSAVVEPNLFGSWRGRYNTSTSCWTRRDHSSTHCDTITRRWFCRSFNSNIPYLNCQELWLKTGVKDKLRYLPVHEIQAFLGEYLCKCRWMLTLLRWEEYLHLHLEEKHQWHDYFRLRVLPPLRFPLESEKGHWGDHSWKFQSASVRLSYLYSLLWPKPPCVSQCSLRPHISFGACVTVARSWMVKNDRSTTS